MEANNSQIPSVALFVTRSEIDFSHRSANPICQRWFMVLYLKSEAKELALTVKTDFLFLIMQKKTKFIFDLSIRFILLI